MSDLNSLPFECADYWWPRDGAAKFDVGAAIAEADDLGFVEVIAQDGMGGEHWIEPFRKQIRSAGKRLSIGLGMDGAWTDPQIAINAICDALDADPDTRVYPDDERKNKWETLAGRQLVQAVAIGVFKRYSVGPNPAQDTPAEAETRAQIRGRIRQAGWWAPLSMVLNGRSIATHPNAPHREWAMLCTQQWPQTYGAGSRFGSLAMLAHSRDNSQYPALGTPAELVLPTFQSYGRDVIDVVRTLTTEPEQNEWDRLERDSRNRAGRLAALALAREGFTGPDAVARFQKLAGIAVDNECGEECCKALGVAWPG